MNNRLQYHRGSIKRAQSFRKVMTDAERKLWSRLRGKQTGYYFRRQKPIGIYIADFVCWKQRLVVELDGSQHYTHKGKERNRVRDQFLNQQGFRVLRFNSAEALKYTDSVLGVILEHLQNPLLSPYKGDRDP